MKKEREKFLKLAEKELANENFESVVEYFEKVIEISEQLGDKSKANQFKEIVYDFKLKLGLQVEEDESEIAEKVQSFLDGLMKSPMMSKQQQQQAIPVSNKSLTEQGENILGKLKSLQEEETILLDDSSQGQIQEPQVGISTPEVQFQVPQNIPTQIPDDNTLQQTPPEPPIAEGMTSQSQGIFQPPSNIPPTPSIPEESQVKFSLPDQTTNTELTPPDQPVFTPSVENISPPTPPPVQSIKQPPSIKQPSVPSPPIPTQGQIESQQSIQMSDKPSDAKIDILKESEDIFKRLKKLQGLISSDSESQIKITPVSSINQSSTPNIGFQEEEPSNQLNIPQQPVETDINTIDHGMPSFPVPPPTVTPPIQPAPEPPKQDFPAPTTVTPPIQPTPEPPQQGFPAPPAETTQQESSEFFSPPPEASSPIQPTPELPQQGFPAPPAETTQTARFSSTTS
ncbi:MAG: hypothetical protein ACTSPY_15265 [Candidatus Helarchaeota archaeon]